MAEWQPIETAPKDGTRILVFGPYCGGLPIMATSKWLPWTEDRVEKGCWYANGVAPTHWMPLPDPPKEPTR